MLHRDTIIHVALIPQLCWIQLLTLLHIRVCVCVTDQTRETLLHCGSGGGLAGEYFLICTPLYTCSPDIAYLTRIRNFVRRSDTYRTRLIAQFPSEIAFAPRAQIRRFRTWILSRFETSLIPSLRDVSTLNYETN